jgi:hypothetical protein
LEAGQALDYQPGPGVPPEKKQRDRLIRLAATHPTWALGFADEVWWSRLAQPHLHSWASTGEELRLVQKTVVKTDPDPKALACYGLLVRSIPTLPEQVWVRFASGQPVGAMTTQFLAWCSERLAALGQHVLLLIWDNASWHTSQAVRAWLRLHNRTVKRTRQGVRILTGRLPSQSPWLNPIEPKWVHGKRAVLEPKRVLTAAELESRVYAYYGCHPALRLMITQEAA